MKALRRNRKRSAPRTTQFHECVRYGDERDGSESLIGKHFSLRNVNFLKLRAGLAFISFSRIRIRDGKGKLLSLEL